MQGQEHDQPCGFIQSILRANIAIVTIARPEKRNALTPAMLDELLSEVRRLGTVAGAMVLSGEGESFCAGFDLSLCKDDGTVMRALLSGLSHCIRAMREAACPVVVSAHGAAIAGGCAILGGADVVLTTDQALIGYPVLKLGISPAVSAPTLALATGYGAARARLLHTQLISGIDAVRIGLASESLPTRDACEARAIEVANALAAKPRHAVEATKRWMNQIDGSNDAEVVRRGAELSASVIEDPATRALLKLKLGL